MNSLSEANAGNQPTTTRLRFLWVALVGSAVAVTAIAVLAAEADLALPVGLALCGAIVLSLVAVLSWRWGSLQARRRYRPLLHEARQQAQVLARLQRDWQWATDAEHHLVRWQAPQRVPASSWVGHAATQTLVERFDCPGECALRQALGAHRDFDGIPARETSGQQWLLRGVACTDAQGRFQGYLGTAERLTEPAPAPDPGEQAALAYTLSHDLRAPLRAVDGFARILKADHGGQLDSRGAEHLDRVLAGAERMHTMLDSLLALNQLSARSLTREPVDLSALAADVFEELRQAAPGREADLHVEPDLRAVGDPVLLRCLLENLLGNAWKYSGRCTCTVIRFEQRSEPGRRIFVVSDKGAGFDMGAADRLFNAFQRLHSASEFPGHGIGLASVRRIVHRHGGEVWAESAPGQGARFYFTLP